MKAAHLLAALAIACLAGCSTPGSQYAKAHPELSRAHRTILTTGIIPGGSAVEGMSKGLIRLAAGDPARVEKLNRGDVWIFVRERFAEMSPGDDPHSQYGSGPSKQRNFTENAHLGPRPVIREVTSIFFQGDRATHAGISQERP